MPKSRIDWIGVGMSAAKPMSVVPELQIVLAHQVDARRDADHDEERRQHDGPHVDGAAQ
jgi:hypothetical protein